MKHTLMLQDGKALEAIKKGVEAIVEPVKRTLGPECGSTLMYRTFNRGPRNVDDGFYTAEVIVPKDPFTRLVADFFKEAVKRTNQIVGDGTSTTAVIAGTLFQHVYEKLSPKIQGFTAAKATTKHGVMALKREILAKANEIKEQIRKVSKPVKTLQELEKISAISLGDDNEISKAVAKLAWEVGTDGFIDVVEGYKGEVEIERADGFRFSAKIADKVFVNKKERFEMIVEDAAIFITNHKLDNDVLVQYIITKCAESKIVFVAPDFSQLVLAKMALSQKTGVFAWPVKVPSLRTEQMEDMAIFTDAILVDKNKGQKLENINGKECGRLQKIIVKDVESREDAIIMGGKGENGTAVKDRIKVLQGQLAETKEPQFKKLMERRIASMASGGGVIRVGAATEAESLPLKLKVEDDVYACRAALRSGFVKGGGLCLKEIADELPDDHILKSALLAPYNQIQANAEGNLTIGKDVIDPTDAVYFALEHAASVVSSLITVKNLIPEAPEVEQGEGEMAIAKAINSYVSAWKREKGIMTENEKLAEQDARGGMTEDEVVALDNG
jgi:chaperonin GroEL